MPERERILMRYTHMLAMAALAIAAVFISTGALAQWSDGGPEWFSLTDPPTEGEICLTKQPETPRDRTSTRLAMR
jgi:hypothetical protein